MSADGTHVQKHSADVDTISYVYVDAYAPSDKKIITTMSLLSTLLSSNNNNNTNFNLHLQLHVPQWLRLALRPSQFFNPDCHDRVDADTSL